MMESLPPEFDHASGSIIGAAVEVHRVLGPGLLESIYEQALVHELKLRGLTVKQQLAVGVKYKDLEIKGQRLDMVVEPGIVVELKTVERLLPIHQAQLLSYLKSTGLRLGLLINFHQEILTRGVKRLVN